MTSISSSIEKSSVRRASFAPLFRFTLRQSWTTLLLFSIIMFFVMPVPVMVSCSNEMYDLAQRTAEFASDMKFWCEIMRILLVPGMSLLAVIMSCVTFRYLKSKVSSDYYHSLPVTRRRLYINQLTVGYIILLLPFIAMLLVSLIIMAFNGAFSVNSDTSLKIAVGVGYLLRDTILHATLFYAFGSLIGMVSGLTAVHFTLACAAVFILPLIYAISFWFVNIFDDTMWLTWYLNGRVMTLLSPAMRFLFNEGEPLSLVECILYVLVTAGLLVGGYYLYAHRKNERAGMAVVYTPLGGVIRYLLIYPGTLCGGVLFYLITDNLVWTVFGMLCGCILTSMITNAILYKTAKAVFKGLRGLCIYLAVIAILLIFLVINAVRGESYIPSVENTARVELSLTGHSTLFTFEDPEDISTVRDICLMKRGALRRWSSNAKAIFYPKFGLPIAKEIPIYYNSDMAEKLTALVESDSFTENYLEMLDIFSYACKQYYYAPYVSIYAVDRDADGVVYEANVYTDSCSDEEHGYGLFHAMRLDIEELGADCFNGMSVGSINMYLMSNIEPSLNENVTRVPLLAKMKHTSDYLLEHGYIKVALEDYPELYIDSVSYIKVENRNTGKVCEFSDRKSIGEIVLSLVNPMESFSDNCIFTPSDSEYIVTVEYKYIGDYTSYIASYTDEGIDTSAYTKNFTRSTAFRLGEIPECVLNRFN